LDYQENRSLGATRWTDRLVSTSGDWSGNVFDFVIEVLRRMQQGLKVPFVLKGNQRVDDTPIHKLLREAITNAVVHADFYGRQGLVIQKSEDGYKLSNPGSVRISISEAINGGISDPRNGIMLKMFSLIDFGERAGSGLSGICKVWEKVYHTPVILEETHNNGVDRTMLTLSTGGNEQDVDAMLALYGGSNDEIVLDATQKIVDNAEDTTQKDNSSTQIATRDTNNTTQKTTQKTNIILTDAQKEIIELIRSNNSITRKQMADTIQTISVDGIKYNLRRLQELGVIRRVGPDKGGYWEVLKP
jgi:predicted HTH transcriptional regulator